nr:IPT/TIG domain-containing protein [uncultured Carboxylicivirga sp.]
MNRKLYIVLIVLLFLGCQKDYQKSDVIVLSTNEVSYDGTTKNGVTFSASIMLDSEYNILEQGFVLGLKSGPTLDDEVLKVDELSNKSFSVLYKDILVPDTTYYIRGYVKTEKYLVYGNEITFFSNGSQPPVISKIEPSVVFWGDTVMITGTNFDKNGENNKVFFNDFISKSVWGGKDTIFAIVPDELNEKKGAIKVNLYGQDSRNTKNFEIHSPIIEGISSLEGCFPMEIVIDGKYFSYSGFNPIKCSLVINGITHSLYSSNSRDSIKFRLPFLGLGVDDLCSIKFSQIGESYLVTDKFKLIPQEIKLKKDSVTIAQPILLNTENLDINTVTVTAKLNEREIASREVVKINSSEFYVYAWGKMEDENFLLDIFLNNKLCYSKVIERAGPAIYEIYTDKLSSYSDLEFYILGVDYSEECWMQMKDINGQIESVLVKPVYNRVPRGYAFRAYVAWPENVIDGEYEVRLLFKGRFSHWENIYISK